MRLVLRLAASIVLACAVIAAGASRARADVVTFDDGFNDPNIPYPGGQYHGPYDWIEGDIRTEGVWITDIATPAAVFQLGHTHLGTFIPAPGRDGQADFIHGWPNDLQGLFIHFEDNRPFRLASLRHRLIDRAGDNLPNTLPWSFADNDGHLLVAATFDEFMPFPAFEAQFEAFPIDDGTVQPGNSNSPALDSPWQTITFTNQFENVTGIYVVSSVDQIFLDDIVLEPMAPPVCSNGADDDGDGASDFPADAGCSSAADASETDAGLLCDNGLDDDGDGVADFPLDPGCTSAVDESERDPTLVCDDGADNDGDGTGDFPVDGGCASPQDPSETDPARICDNGGDDDADGFADFPLDLGCTGSGDGSEREAGRICDDGVDNDGDGQSDFPADVGCGSPADPSEADAARVCDDGIDNDTDGLADFPADHGCTNGEDPSERDGSLACDDGLDNDSDGLTDFPFDPDCENGDDASEGGAPPQVPVLPIGWGVVLGAALLAALVYAAGVRARRANAK